MVAVSNLVKRPTVGALSTSPVTALAFKNKTSTVAPTGLSAIFKNTLGLKKTTTGPTAEEKSDKIFKEVGIGTENSGDKKKKRLKGLRGGGGAEATLLGE